MGWGILDVYHFDDEGSSGKPVIMKPLGRVEAALRWCVFAPCGWLACIVSYYTMLFLGDMAWGMLGHSQGGPAPSDPPFLYRYIFHMAGLGIAGYMGVTLGALAAPAHRGLAGAGVLGTIFLWTVGLLALMVEKILSSPNAGEGGGVLFSLLPGVALMLAGGICAVWSLARVFGWRGAPAFPATEYWKRLGRRGRRRAGLS